MHLVAEVHDTSWLLFIVYRLLTWLRCWLINALYIYVILNVSPFRIRRASYGLLTYLLEFVVYDTRVEVAGMQSGLQTTLQADVYE